MHPDAAPFKAALEVAMAKVDEYYNKTAESDAHVMALCELFVCWLCNISLHSMQCFTQSIR